MQQTTTPAKVERKVLVVDDERDITLVMKRLLEIRDYRVITATSAQEALRYLDREIPSLILSDVHMPETDGYAFCREIRRRFSGQIVPVVLMTGMDPVQERVRGLEAGADDFLVKPINKEELLARVRSLVRIRELHDTVQNQAEALARWGKELEQRVHEQVEQLGQVKRFFSPQIADILVSSGKQNLMNSHRKEVSVVFIDLRGFTAFAETAEPEEVMEVLEEYYEAAGNHGLAHDATIGRLAGDGMMFFLNDPVDIPNHQEKAIQMTLAIRDSLSKLRNKWVLKYDLDFGMGIASGHATLGTIGFEKFWDYSVIGSVTNLAARLCEEAKGGQILVSERFLGPAIDRVNVDQVGQINFKGFHRPVKVYNVLGMKS